MRPWAARAATTLALAALGGCAPIARWQPALPLADAAARARTTGRLEGAGGADSTIVILYGDNRPGWRMQSRHVEFGVLRGLRVGGAGGILKAIAMIPAVLVESIVPALDGPRDLVDKMRCRPTGGGEQRMLRALDGEPHVDLVVNLGDMVQDGRRGRLWKDWWERHRPLRERVPFLAAPGNHERLDDATARANFEAALPSGGGDGRYWHALELPAASTRIVILDSDVMVDVSGTYPDAVEDALVAAQLAWADSALALPAARKIVCMHHPLVGAGRYDSDWAPRGADDRAARRRAALLALCERHGVDVVFAGHEHLYQRVRVNASGGGGFWHITNGCGGSPLHYVSGNARARVMNQRMPNGEALGQATLVKKSTYAYTRLVLPSDTSAAMRAETFEVSLFGHTRPLDRVSLGPARGASR